MLIGKRINGRYKILQLIGGGGMSHVYLAEDMILNREVAIKVLRHDFSNEEELQRRFQREALAATTLVHPNIVGIYDVGNDENYHFIVMEYIKGKTLKQYIQEFSPIAPAKAVQIMKQLTSAIEHAHAYQIIHRDIKPQNILVDQNGNVKVTDFGIATTLSATSYTKTNSVIGTVHYLSPEQAKGGLATHKSDIYALGIVLYELLTGELPFSGESAVSIALKHLQTETPSVRAFDSTIPQSIENVVLKATAKEPIHRYETVAEMGMDLESALSPQRVNEPKYYAPLDEGATKIIPVIKEPPKPIQFTPPTDVERKVEEPIKVEQQPKKSEKKSKKKWLIPLLALIVVAVAIAVYLFMKPSKIEIPNVSNLTLEEATDLLEDAGFVVGNTTERYDEEVELGRVIESTPKAGLLRVKGSEIDVTVSLGIETSEMANYVGSQLSQVQPMLEKMFKEIIVEEVNSDEDVGEILEQTPMVGTQIIPEQTVITFKVSKGLKEVEVSNLINYTEAALRDYERSSGLKVVIEGDDYSDNVPVGSVLSQVPTAGSKLKEGEQIKVKISKGPAEKVSKTYVQNIIIPYEPSEEGAEQIITVFIQDKANSLVDVYEEFKITENTSYRITLEIEEGEKAAYQILRDNIVILKETIPYEN